LPIFGEKIAIFRYDHFLPKSGSSSSKNANFYPHCFGDLKKIITSIPDSREKNDAIRESILRPRVTTPALQKFTAQLVRI
jgi:hypothetical protein